MAAPATQRADPILPLLDLLAERGIPAAEVFAGTGLSAEDLAPGRFVPFGATSGRPRQRGRPHRARGPRAPHRRAARARGAGARRHGHARRRDAGAGAVRPRGAAGPQLLGRRHLYPPPRRSGLRGLRRPRPDAPDHPRAPRRDPCRQQPGRLRPDPGRRPPARIPSRCARPRANPAAGRCSARRSASARPRRVSICHPPTSPCPFPLPTPGPREQTLAGDPRLAGAGRGSRDPPHTPRAPRPPARGALRDGRGRPTRLASAPRTLRRALAREGTTFEAVRDTVRLKMAQDLLAMSGLPIGQLALTLDFATPSAFIHAFRRWTGETPAAWRQRNRRLAPEPRSTPAATLIS